MGHRSIEARLLKRRDWHLAQVAEIERALATLRTVFGESARNGFGKKLSQAITAERNGQRERKPLWARKTKPGTGTKRAQMPPTGAVLAAFGATPLQAHELAEIMAKEVGRPFKRNAFAAVIASMARYGYLKRKGDGYVRTSKPWTKDEPHRDAAE